MTTTWTAIDPSKPDATAQTLTQMGQSMRNNLNAMRAFLATMGGIPGFNRTQSGGTADAPTTELHTKGTEQVRITITYTSGNCTKEKYEYSSDSGSTWAPMVDDAGNYFANYTYDGNNNCTATTWGTS
jgi:hypothetical protein